MFTCQICSKEIKRGDNTHRHVKTVQADFQDDNETIDDRENPESMEKDDASNKADDDESYIQDKAETDESDDDVEEEAEEEKRKRIQMTRGVYL